MLLSKIDTNLKEDLCGKDYFRSIFDVFNLESEI